MVLWSPPIPTINWVSIGPDLPRFTPTLANPPTLANSSNIPQIKSWKPWITLILTLSLKIEQHPLILFDLGKFFLKDLPEFQHRAYNQMVMSSFFSGNIWVVISRVKSGFNPCFTNVLDLVVNRGFSQRFDSLLLTWTCSDLSVQL